MNKKTARFILSLLFSLALLPGIVYGNPQEGAKTTDEKKQAQGGSQPESAANNKEPGNNKDSAADSKKTDQAKPISTVTTSAGKQGKDAFRLLNQGISVEISIDPSESGKDKPSELIEGESAVVKLKITDTATNTPVRNLRPTVWIDRRRGTQTNSAEDCRNKIQSFLQGSLRTRPDIDLNTYYIIALNKENSISVIDPILSYGTSKLYTMIPLKSPGEDWVHSRDGRRLFVTMPMVNQVAVIDTITWKVLANIQVGVKPTRIALQPDGKYVWVCNDGLTGSEKSGVSVIDSTQLKLVSHIQTGAGRHEIAFTDNDLYAFVTNRQDGTLSVIDVQKLAKVKQINTGPLPAGLTFSALSNAAYVANEGDGAVLVIDGRRHEVLARMNLAPGLKAIRFAPGGRMGFVTGPKNNAVYIFDASTNRVIQTVEVAGEPTQVSFTEGFAYIRSLGTEQVTMIELTGLAKNGTANMTRFPAGQLPPGKSSNFSLADAIVPAPGGNGVFVANPSDKTIYYYAQGMAAPMGSFQNYRREGRAVSVVDRSLRETSPGVYSISVKLTGSGTYDVPFLLDSPRTYHCFETAIKPNPALAAQKQQVAFKVEPMLKDDKIQAGKPAKVQFKLIDSQTKQPRAGIKDVRVLTMLAPGTWHTRQWARAIEGGVYEVEFTPPESGVYYIFWECPSLNMKFNQNRFIILDGREQDAAPPEKNVPASKPAGN